MPELELKHDFTQMYTNKSVNEYRASDTVKARIQMSKYTSDM